MTGTAHRTAARRDGPPSLGDHTRDTGNVAPRGARSRATGIPRGATRPAEHARCRCDHTWTGLTAAHCSACHRTFAGPTLFDKHRTAHGEHGEHGEHGQCKNPAHIHHNSTGEPLMFYRNGIWRGREMTETEKAARRGT